MKNSVLAIFSGLYIQSFIGAFVLFILINLSIISFMVITSEEEASDLKAGLCMLGHFLSPFITLLIIYSYGRSCHIYHSAFEFILINSLLMIMIVIIYKAIRWILLEMQIV